ncbi:WYL domain-containing protein [Bradyrhizobium oligotrophicum]|uniref:WYL domain-containing protein n=1 Tax=Bradyrhizobium oligotrophicum TaxID=44255 RepID=UPI003EB89F90
MRPKKSSPGSSASEFRWSVERRLAFIEERLFWLGEANRTDLVRQFGVSLGQASADIARYLALGPRGVVYDRSAKRYVAEDDFRPVFATPDPNRLLGELRLAERGIVALDDTVLGGASPPFDATPVPHRKIDTSVLRTMLRSVRMNLAVDLFYQSMSRPEPIRRTVEPHAFAYDGFRWHVRAFDRQSGGFRDFVLGRIKKPKLAGGAVSSSREDADWHAFVDLVIAPHPRLTPAQTQAIAIDYEIRGGSTTIKVRRALLFYALKRLGLDVALDARPPNEQHIVLLNRIDVDKVLAAARPSQSNI